jgi:hypothetical protein
MRIQIHIEYSHAPGFLHVCVNRWHLMFEVGPSTMSIACIISFLIDCGAIIHTAFDWIHCAQFELSLVFLLNLGYCVLASS